MWLFRHTTNRLLVKFRKGNRLSFYDLLFFASRDVKVNLKYLNSKLQDSGHINKARVLKEKELIELLKEKFSETDFEKAKKDVKPFLKQNSLALYLKKNLKSSQYMDRQGRQKPNDVSKHGSFLTATAGEIQ